MPDSNKTEPYIGMEIEPAEFEIDPKLLTDYSNGLGIETRERPPLMIATHADRASSIMFSQMRGHLWLRQEWEFQGGLEPGVRYETQAEVLDIYPRRNRTILLTQTTLQDPADGSVALRMRHHQSFLLDQPADADVNLRDPKAKEGASVFSLPEGHEIGKMERDVTLEMCGEFFHGSKNYHSDKKASEELGFEDVVVGGAMTMGFVGLVLEDALGQRWTDSGRLLVKFTNVLWPNERIVIRALSQGTSAHDPAREDIFTWVEKADGTTVIVASGSVAAP